MVNEITNIHSVKVSKEQVGFSGSVLIWVEKRLSIPKISSLIPKKLFISVIEGVRSISSIASLIFPEKIKLYIGFLLASIKYYLPHSGIILDMQYAHAFGIDFRISRVYFCYGAGKLLSNFIRLYQLAFGTLEGLSDLRMDNGAEQKRDFNILGSPLFSL